MNAIPNAFSPAARHALRRAWAVLPASLLPLLGTVGADAAEAKTHTLFMGADVYVEQNHQACRVEDVVGGSFVITVDGKEVKIPANYGQVKMRVDSELKLTSTGAKVDRFKAERAYTPENDPVKQFLNRQSEMMAVQDAAATAAVRVGLAQTSANVAKFGAAGVPGGSPVQGMPSANPAIAESNFTSAAMAEQAASGHLASSVGAMQDALAKELYDAINLEFDVTSTQPVRRPYVIVLVQYHAKGAKPGESSRWLYAAQLDPLGDKPQKVRVKQGGLPPGYEIEKCQVHVYDGGQELATNLAENQVALTRTEAFAYLLLEYVGTHKGANLGAAPIMGRPDAEAMAKLGPDRLRQTYYVKVSKEGLPLATFADADCSRPVDADIAALVAAVRFYPALENGKPIDGVAQLRLSRLSL